MGSRGCAHARPSARPLPGTAVLRRARSIEARPRARLGGAEGGSWAVGPTPRGSAPGPTRPFPLPPSWALEAPGAPAGVHLPPCAPGRSRAGLLAAAEAAGARKKADPWFPAPTSQTLPPPPWPLPAPRGPSARLFGKTCGSLHWERVSSPFIPAGPRPLTPPALLAPTCR